MTLTLLDKKKTFQKWKMLSLTSLVLFGALMIAIPVTNHYFFRTFSFDYAAYNFAFHDYAHFSVSPNPVYFQGEITFLQDHLSFTFFFLAPFYWLLKWIFGTYTLLILQSLFVIWGGWASWKLIVEKTESHVLGFLTLILYFTLYGRFSAFSADCNLMIILSSFVPVFLLYFHRGKVWITVACFLFLVLGRESMPLWTLFISLFLMIIYWKDLAKRRLSIIFSVASVVYFIIAFKFLIPLIEDPNRPFSLFNYSNLGETPFEALTFMFSHPIDTIELLFTNPSGDAYYDGVKGEFYFVYLLSGGILLFLRPQYMLPLVPIVAQKMFNDSPIRWGIASYYDIEFAALMPLLIALVLASMNWKKVALFLGSVACIMSVSITWYKLEPSHCELPWAAQGKINPFVSSFWKSDLSIRRINEQLDKIPSDASVSATGNVLPHLALRDAPHFLPSEPKNVEYIVLLDRETHPFLTEEDLRSKIRTWKSDTTLRVFYEDSELLIFERKKH